MYIGFGPFKIGANVMTSVLIFIWHTYIKGKYSTRCYWCCSVFSKIEKLFLKKQADYVGICCVASFIRTGDDRTKYLIMWHNGKMSRDKMSCDKMSRDKMSLFKMSRDKMPFIPKCLRDKMSTAKMSTAAKCLPFKMSPSSHLLASKVCRNLVLIYLLQAYF
jgi:hypothetical protein